MIALRRKLNNKLQSCAICDGDNLTGYLDGVLDGKTMRQVDAHLRTCVVCRQVFQGLEQTRALLCHSKEELSVPSQVFWSDAYRRARIEAPALGHGEWGWRRSRRHWGVLAISAAFVTVLGLMLFVSAPVGNHSQTSNVSQVFDQVDVTSLISAHADYVAGKRLVDGSNNRILRSDMAAQTTGDQSLAPADVTFVESAANGTSD